MQNKRTIKGLKFFSYLFFALALLCLIGGLIGALTIDVPQSETDSIRKASENLGRFVTVLVGGFYSLTFAFFGFVSRALAVLVAAQERP